MPAISLATAEAQLTAWLAASTAVAGGQAYKIGERSLTRADAGEILKMIEFWSSKVEALEAGTTSIRARLITPIT